MGGLGCSCCYCSPTVGCPALAGDTSCDSTGPRSFLGEFWVALAPGPLDGLAPIRNPLEMDSLELAGARSPFDVFEVPQIVIVVVGTSSVLVRLHGAGLEERQQIKWCAYAAVVLTSAILLRVQTLGWASARPYARPPYLMTASWRSRFVKGSIQP